MSTIERGHTLCAARRADPVARRTACDAPSGTPIADICRPAPASPLGPENRDRALRLPSDPVHPELRLAVVHGKQSLDDIVTGENGASLMRRLVVAREIARRLADLHAAHILHASLTAEAIRVDPETGDVDIIDLCEAVVLPLGASLSNEVLRDRGTVALTPEGAARSSQPIDHRSDLYRLGDLLFRLFVGSAAFAGEDRASLMHAHIATVPGPEEGAAWPPAVRRIVMALLEKSPERRYARAADLASDLDRCVAALRRDGHIHDFPLRIEPLRASFARGGLFYGRDDQLRRLVDGQFNAKRGRSRHFLLAGPSGMGKSTLIRRFVASVKDRNGIVGVGRFERADALAPFAGVSHCVDDLLASALSGSDGGRSEILSAIATRLENNVGALAIIAPSLHRWFGSERPPFALDGPGAIERLAQAVLGLVGALGREDRAVALVFDDMQWADAASLDLIAAICREAGDEVVLVGSTRVEEDEDGLALAANALTVDGVPPVRLDLQPLNRSDVEDILLNVFGARPRADEAADLIYAKTLGAPLFVSQILGAIDEEASFEAGEGWDPRQIAAIAGSESVAGFVERRIGSLPEIERALLVTGAHLGPEFTAADLGAVADLGRGAVEAGLRVLVETGLMVRVTEVFTFVHDRIREAAYGLSDDRCAIHRRIARLWNSREGETGTDRHVFRTLAQFDAAGDLSAWPDLVRAHRDILCEAAREAHRNSAFASARACAARALDVADRGIWEVDADARAALTLVKVGSALALGDHAGLEGTLEVDRRAMRTDEERLSLALLEVLSLHARSLDDASLGCGLVALERVGVNLPADRGRQGIAAADEFARLQAALSGRGASVFASLPASDDRATALAMEILYRLAPVAHNTQRSELFALMALRNANLLLAHGRSEQASSIVMTLALTLSAMTGDVVFADGFAQVAMAMDPAVGQRTPASVSFIYAYFFNHWLHPLETSLAINVEGMRVGAETGDIQFAAFHAAAYVIHLSATGAPLQAVARVGREHGAGLAGRMSVSAFHNDLETSFAEALLGLTASPTSLERHRVVAAHDVIAKVETLAPTLQGFFLVRNLQLAFLFGHLPEAGIYADALEPIMPAIVGNTAGFDAAVFSLLTSIARGERPARFDALLAQLRRWAELSPENHGPRCDLVLASEAFHEGRVGESAVLFDRAVEGARAQRQPHIGALASERAGRSWISLGDRVAGLARLREAIASYERWGAVAKVRTLREEFPELFEGVAWPGLSHAARASIDGFAAVSSAALEISAEVDMRALVATVMGSAQRLAGGNYGALILKQDQGYYVEAVFRHGEGLIEHGSNGEPIENSRSIPVSVVRAVERSKRALVIDDAPRSDHGADPYVRSRRVASMLCAPLIRRGNLDGFIYVENDLAVGAFSESSSQSLQVLAAQAAVALNNARLFGLLEGTRVELAEANRSLELRIEARTRELALARNDALDRAAEADRARKAEKAANDAKSRFLGVVSHEIRTPLNGMLGMLQLLRRDRLAETEQRQIDIAQRSGFGLVGLLDGILDLSRLEAGTASITPETFEIGQLADGAVEVFRPAAEGKGLTLDVRFEAPRTVRLRSDAQGLARVLTNLVNNAVKFTPSGGVCVTIALDGSRDGAGTSTLRLSVADTGIGVPRILQDHIFEDFMQADPSIARRYGGSGLGLAICRNIVGLLQGTIAVESREGVGSTFVVEVPVETSVEVDARSLPAPLVGSIGHRRRVLVVDDDEINREVAGGLLLRLGHDVVCVDGCAAALEATAGADFDAVLLDLQMPDVDGLETARRIRHASAGRALPRFLLLTADVTVARDASAFEGTIDGVVTKPVSARSLSDALARLPSRELPCIDASAFTDLCTLFETGTMVDLLRRFARTARDTRACLAVAVADGDCPSVARLAHRFRSAAGSLHLVEVEGLAERIEAEASRGRIDPARLASLEGACGRAIKAAMAELRCLHDPGRRPPIGQTAGSTLTANL